MRNAFLFRSRRKMSFRNDVSSLPYKAIIVWFPSVSMYLSSQLFIIVQLHPFNNVYSLGELCCAFFFYLIDFFYG